jgi:hypothetical protein
MELEAWVGALEKNELESAIGHFGNCKRGFYLPI